jgi:chromosome segregation ATPase
VNDTRVTFSHKRLAQMSLIGEEEEESDELASIAIETHELRAEKIRLEEVLEARREFVNRDIAEAKAKVAAARAELFDLDLTQLTQRRIPEKRFVPRNRSRFDPVKSDLEMDIAAAQEMLDQLKAQLEQQESYQQAEISRLMNKVKRKKADLDAINAEAERIDGELEAKIDSIRWTRSQIRSIEEDTRAVVAETASKERTFRKVARDADAIVHRVYRTKSKHV